MEHVAHVGHHEDTREYRRYQERWYFDQGTTGKTLGRKRPLCWALNRSRIPSAVASMLQLQFKALWVFKVKSLIRSSGWTGWYQSLKAPSALSWASRIFYGLWNIAVEGQSLRTKCCWGFCLLPGGLVEAERKQQPRRKVAVRVLPFAHS